MSSLRRNKSQPWLAGTGAGTSFVKSLRQGCWMARLTFLAPVLGALEKRAVASTVTRGYRNS